MTYCLSLHCGEGLVFLSDSRTTAGIDNVTLHPKMRVYEKEGDRVLCILSSGNLSITQSVSAFIDRDMERAVGEAGGSCLMNQHNLYDTARYVGERIREVRKLDAEALRQGGLDFNINLIVGGQIGSQPPEIYQVYAEGNAIHASRQSPFLQIGELKYGKPIVDRGFTYDPPLHEAVKFGLLSLDSTAKSNLSVGTPFELFCYRAGDLRASHRMVFENDHPYLMDLRDRWQNGLIQLVHAIPPLDCLHR